MNVHGIPSVEAVLQEPAVRALLASLRRDVVVECVRECVAALRDELRGTVGSSDRARLDKPTVAQGDAAELVAARVAERLCPPQRFSLRRVANATGVIIHTNLGRAPQATPDGFAHVAETIGGYCNLEVDVATGERSHRDVHVAGLLTRLTGAEAATVVNNNAAAVVLTLTALAAGQRVVCSRGELVEIGGSFRLPEIIACSGAHLVEVGTTNHARVRDYEAALTPDTAAIMKIHPSNFRIIGFTSEVPLKELADLAHRSGTLLVFDAGSGLLLPNDGPVFANEPVVRQAIADGADIVTFSADKLLGGPQAGGIAGRRGLLQRINRHPLKRAVRVGKMTLAALEAALQAHLRPGAPDTTVMSLIRRPLKDLERAARSLAKAIGRVAPDWRRSIERDEASIGGGSLPGETVPTAVLWLEAPGLAADTLDRAFRLNEPPIFGRFRKGRFGLDLRTLLRGDAADIVACVARLARSGST